MDEQTVKDLMDVRGYCFYTDVSQGVDVNLVFYHMDHSCLTAITRWYQTSQVEVKLKGYWDGLLLQTTWIPIQDEQLFKAYGAKMERALRTLGAWK